MKNFFVPDYMIMDFEFYDMRRVQMHFHQNIEMFMVLEGSGNLILDEEEVSLEPGDYYVVNVNRRHAFEADQEVLYVCLHINFNVLSHYIDMNRAFFLCSSQNVKSEVNIKIKKMMKRILSTYFAKTGMNQVRLSSYYYSLLDILLNECLVYVDDERFRNRKSADQNRLNEIVNYVYANYRNEVSLNELADQLYLSTAYLSKYIKNRLGMTFTDYVNNIRLYHAVDEIRSSDKKMTYIALDNGFPNVTAFNKAFKRIYNTTPVEFRQEEKKKDAVTRSKVLENAQVSKKARSYIQSQEVQQGLSEGGSQETSYVFADAYEPMVYQKYWNKMINIGYMHDLLLSDTQKHVLILKEKLGFQYMRFWDIYAEEMHLNLINGEEYNFATMDRVFDFLHQNRIYPYIELGFKPRRLVETLDGFIISEDREVIFASLREYGNFLNMFLAHYVNRFGIEEIERWKFEQWKDPRLFEEEEDFHLYFELFETAYQVIKSFSPSIQIGGGSIHRTFDENKVEDLLEQWNKRMMHPDFITIYSYPYRTGAAGQTVDQRRSQNPHYLSEQITVVKDILTRIGMHVKEVHVSEWNATVSNRNRISDSCYKGAYIMKNIIDNIGEVDLLGYWLGSDLFSQYNDSNRVLTGGVGLLSRDGIRKPSYYAFDFMNRSGKYIVGKTENALVTSNGENQYYVVVHNYKQPNYKYYITPENEINVTSIEQYFDDYGVKNISCQIKNVKNGTYKIKVEKINTQEGSALDEWIRMGEFDSLTVADVEYLRQIAAARISMWESEVQDTTLNFETTLEANEMQYIQIMFCF